MSKQTDKQYNRIVIPESSGLLLSSSLDFSSVLRLRPLGDFGVEVVFVGSDSFGFEVAAGVVASLGLRPLLAGGGVSSSLGFLLPENCKLQFDEKNIQFRKRKLTYQWEIPHPAVWLEYLLVAAL